MARRKKASSRRTRGKKQQYRLMDNLLGIIVCLLMLVGLFNLGVLGTFLDNCFKIFVGSSFPIAMIIMDYVLHCMGIVRISKNVGLQELLLPTLVY